MNIRQFFRENREMFLIKGFLYISKFILRILLYNFLFLFFLNSGNI